MSKPQVIPSTRGNSVAKVEGTGGGRSREGWPPTNVQCTVYGGGAKEKLKRRVGESDRGDGEAGRSPSRLKVRTEVETKTIIKVGPYSGGEPHADGSRDYPYGGTGLDDSDRGEMN